MPQTFNETFLPDAAVPQTGNTSGAAPKAQTTSAVGTPAIQSFDPASNMRVTTVTKQAARANTSGGAAKFRPAAVDAFNDRSV